MSRDAQCCPEAIGRPKQTLHSPGHRDRRVGPAGQNGDVMLRRVRIAGTAFAALSAFAIVSQPAAAGSCAVLSEGAIGVKQSEAADRAKKQLKRKIDRWAAKNGYKKVRYAKSSLDCTRKGSVSRCTATAKVCG